MARAVSTARASIAAVSDPFATEVDHGGVAESPLGPVSLCRLDFLSHSETDLDSFVHSPDGTIIEEFKLPRLAAAAGSPSNPDCRFPHPPSETTHFSV